MANDINLDINKNIKKDYRITKIEKGYSGHLSTIGKIACFEWNLNNIEMTEEDIADVIPIEKPMKTISFIEGYNRAEEMIHLGFTIVQYKEFLENLNPRIKQKMDKILENTRKHKQNNTIRR